jgi:hypothetical protein
MKVLVATKESQGELPGDYSWTVEGELVTPAVLECHSPGTCGCGRGFPGLASERATTTAMVVDRPDLERDDLWDALYDSLERQGWLRELESDEIDEVVGEHLQCIEIVCANYPVGTIVGRWGTKVWSRAESAAA